MVSGVISRHRALSGARAAMPFSRRDQATDPCLALACPAG